MSAMKQFGIICLFLISFSGLQAQNQDTVYLSLDQALELGLQNNFQIQISNADLQIAENNNTLGNAGMLPTVTAGIMQSNRYDNSESNTVPDARDEIQSHSLRPNANAQMILFNGFRIQTNKANLELSEESARIEMQNTVENTLSEIIHAYYYVLLEQEKLDVLKELTKLSKDRYRYIEERLKLGTAVSYDMLQVKNAFLQDSANYLTQQSAYSTAMRRLNKALADTSFTDYVLTDELSAEIRDYSLAELEALLLEKNTNLEMMRTGSRMTENYIKIAESARYPSLALNAGTDYTQSWAKYNQNDFNDSYSYNMYANLNLSYTIFDGGNRKRQIANARIEAEKMQLQINDLELQLKSNLYALSDMYEVRKQVLLVARENLEAAELNLEISKDRFERGAINSFNYRDVQINYLNAAYTKLQAEYNLTATHTDLMQITGGLIE
jgi:outer membrane protein